MNWILTILFIAEFSMQNLLLGSCALQIFGFRKPSLSLKWIAGYLSFYSLLFIPGEISYFFRVPWIVYFLLTLAFVLGADLFAWKMLFRNRSWKSVLNQTADSLKRNLPSLLKNNWIGLLFVFVFTWFSMSNQQAFLFMNYDDPYYVGKVVHLIDSDRIYMLNYFSGAYDPGSNSEIFRMISIYELAYAWLAAFFRISPAFFVRVSMAVCNYFLFYLCIRSLARLFVSDELAQYSIAAFFILLLPSSQFVRNLGEDQSVYIYDCWQFTNAAYYGGSVVRMSGLPILYLSARGLFERFEWKKVFWIVWISIGLVSFSSIYITYCLYFATAFLLIRAGCHIVDMIRKRMDVPAVLGIFLLFFTAAIVLKAKYRLEGPQAMNEFSASVVDFWNVFYSKDPVLFLIQVLPAIGLLFSLRNPARSFFLTSLVLGFLVLPMNGGYLDWIYSFGYEFVYLRMLTAMQMAALFEFGLLILMGLNLLHKKAAQSAGALLSAAVLVYTLFLFFTNYSWYLQPENIFAGSGTSEEGWDFSRLFSFSEDMVPDPVNRIGDYLDSQPYDQYLMALPDTIHEDNLIIDQKSALIASNRAAVVLTTGTGLLMPEDEQVLYDYVNNGNGDLETVTEILEKYDISLIGANEGPAREQLASSSDFEAVVLPDGPDSEGGFTLFRLVQ